MIWFTTIERMELGRGSGLFLSPYENGEMGTMEIERWEWIYSTKSWGMRCRVSFMASAGAMSSAKSKVICKEKSHRDLLNVRPVWKIADVKRKESTRQRQVWRTSRDWRGFNRTLRSWNSMDQDFRGDTANELWTSGKRVTQSEFG